MKSRRLKRTALRMLPVLLAVGLLMSFAPSALALFTNGGFETGTIAAPWNPTHFLNPGLSGATPFTGASIVRNAGGSDLTQIRGPFATMSQTDANTGNVLHYPLSGSYCAVINYQGNNRNGNALSQQDTTTAADVAPDGKIHVQFAWAGVVQNPAHADAQQPYIYIALTNVTKGTLLYETFNFAGTSAVWHNAANTVQYTDWQVIDIPCDSSAVAIADEVKLEAVAAGCSLGGHWGYLYVDHFGAFNPVTPSITASDKVFDGTTAATITGRSLSGVVPGDDVSLSGGAATFDTAAAGTGKTVTATGLSLTGADADKYMLTSFTATTTASIYTVPTVTTAALSSVTATTAAGGGDVTADGGSAVTERGVCWNTSANPTTSDSHTTDGTGTGAFASSLAGLTENTTYHVRAYATNAAGTSYGADRTLTTTFTVSFVTDGTSGASLAGSDTQSVPDGGSTTAVTAVAPVGYHFVDWTYDAASSTNNPLTLGPIAASVTVTAHFAIDTFTLSYAAGSNGTLSGATSQSVDYGGSGTPVTAVPDTGYHFVAWSDGVLTAIRTDSGVSGVVDVTASFAIDTYTLSYAAGAHGSLTGDASQTVTYGGSGTAVTAVPDTGYHFVGWSDGVLTATRTDSGVGGDLAATASFAIDSFVITAGAGQHGAISPAGAVSVDFGSDQTFTITPDPYYRVADVLVDGVSVGAVSSRTFSGVTADHTISASFAPLGPPTTTVKGLPKGWVRHAVRLRLVATPSTDGAPVDYTEYRIGSGPWTRGTTVIIQRQGVTTVTYRSVDIIGGVETARTCVVRIDRIAPMVSVGGEVNVTHGHVAHISYGLRDNLGGVLRCRLVVRWHGKVVLNRRLGLQRVGRPLVATLRCTLPVHAADHYRYRIVAVDAAGNRAVSPGPGPELEVWRGIWFD
jgi:hypothetical protein